MFCCRLLFCVRQGAAPALRKLLQEQIFVIQGIARLLALVLKLGKAACVIPSSGMSNGRGSTRHDLTHPNMTVMHAYMISLVDQHSTAGQQMFF